MNSGVSLDLLIETGNCCVHAMITGAPQRLTSFTLYEDATHAGSVEGVPKNKNRCSTNVPKLRYSSEVTVSTNGTLLFQDFQGQSAGGNRQLFGDSEIVLAANTTYLIKGFNNATSAGIIAVGLDFYETLP